MKLDHIQLSMPQGEEESARKFFVGLLGMEEEAKPFPLNQRGGCWFKRGDVILHIGVESNYHPQKKAHPAFVVTDIHELEQTLIDNDFDVIWDDTLSNRIRFYTTDPFGNRLEFLNDGDGFSQK